MCDITMQLMFVIRKESDFWVARCLEQDIFTQGTTLDELMNNIKEAVELHFEEELETSPIQILSVSQTEVGCNAQIANS